MDKDIPTGAHTHNIYFGNSKYLVNIQHPDIRAYHILHLHPSSLLSQGCVCLRTHILLVRDPHLLPRVSSGSQPNILCRMPVFYCLLSARAWGLEVSVPSHSQMRGQPRPQQTPSPGWGVGEFPLPASHLRARPLCVSPQSAWSSQRGRHDLCMKLPPSGLPQGLDPSWAPPCR